MDLRRLSNFLRAAECGSLSRAAEELGLAQPALTQQIAALEHRFGTPLLVRSSRGVRPTPAGEELMRQTRSILQQATALTASVRAAGRPAGEVSVALPTALAPFLGPLVAAAVQAVHPDIRLRIFEAESLLGRELAARGRADLTVTCEAARHSPAPQPAGAMELAGEPLFRQPLALLCQAGEGDREGEPIALREALARVRVLPGAGNPVHDALLEALAPDGIPPAAMAVEMHAFALQTAAVATGLGPAITTWMPLDAGRRAQGLVFRPLTAPPVALQVRLWAAATPPGAAVAVVRGFLRDVALRMAAEAGWPRPGI